MASNDEPTALTPSAEGGFDRQTVERILARATQLNSASTGESTDLISHEQLYEIAKEVGLPPSVVTQALAEERTRLDIEPEPETRWLSTVTGPTVVSAQRIVTGDAMRAMGVLDRWMQDGEYLQVQRQFPDRMVWEPRSDWAALMLKAWRSGRRSYSLRETRSVAATIVPLDTERIIVRLDADLLPSRNQRVGMGVGVGALGVAMGAAFGIIGSLFHVAELATVGVSAIPIVGASAGGYAILRSHRNVVARVTLGLEQAIDKLDYGAPQQKASIASPITRPRLR